MNTHEYKVEMLAGGDVNLLSEAEVDRWNTLAHQYIDDFGITYTNDKAMLDVILQQHIVLFRAQQAINGLVPELDDEGLPTGRMHYTKPKPSEIQREQEIIIAASKEIRAMEVSLGLDKKSRDASGQQTLESYIAALREVGHEYGVHIVERTKAFEFFVMELSWRSRLNETGDDEDKAYRLQDDVHDCSDTGVLAWVRENLETLRAIDAEFAAQKGKLYTGRV